MTTGNAKPHMLNPRQNSGRTEIDIDAEPGQAQVQPGLGAMRSPAPPPGATELDVPGQPRAGVSPPSPRDVGHPPPRPARHTQIDWGDSAPEAPAQTAPGIYAGARRVAGLLVREDRCAYYPLFEGTNRIGRDPGRDIVLDDPMVSGAQCTLTVAKSGRFSLNPAEGARNPVLLDGNDVDLAVEVMTPAVVRIGGTNYTVVRLDF